MWELISLEPTNFVQTPWIHLGKKLMGNLNQYKAKSQFKMKREVKQQDRESFAWAAHVLNNEGRNEWPFVILAFKLPHIIFFLPGQFSEIQVRNSCYSSMLCTYFYTRSKTNSPPPAHCNCLLPWPLVTSQMNHFQRLCKLSHQKSCPSGKRVVYTEMLD